MKAYFAWKQLKADYSKNIWKEKNRKHGCFSLGWLHISVKNAGAHKVGKVVSFWSSFDPNLPIFGEHKKGKLNILKKVGLCTTLKEIIKKSI